MMREIKRSLYQCFNAKVLGNNIYCLKEHSLSEYKGGKIPIASLKKGYALEKTVCQGCLDYEEMGEPIHKDERGWK